ncbi:MAG: hypothetical protein ACEY3L_20600 [Wolbachia sp.]
MSFQCLTLESSFPYNLIENVVTTFYASVLSSTWIPVSATFMTRKEALVSHESEQISCFSLVYCLQSDFFCFCMS